MHNLMEPQRRGCIDMITLTSLNSRLNALYMLNVTLITGEEDSVLRTNHKKASKIWRHENIQLGGCQS
ncbi:hypothetical protein PS865_05477 [Pseudomonas fluorescens]|nr:hypothetical protein PS865_05477 [Pseudomonas fluorescens]